MTMKIRGIELFIPIQMVHIPPIGHDQIVHKKSFQSIFFPTTNQGSFHSQQFKKVYRKW